MTKVSAIIVAAGKGARFGSPKQFAMLRGRTVLDWCVERFDRHEGVEEIILVLPSEEQKEKFFETSRKITAVVRGGTKRQDSVLQGFSRVRPENAEVVLIHDGARPLVGKELISRIIETAAKKGAAVPALPIEDTVKEVEGEIVLSTPERRKLVRVQTPQGFSYSLLKRSLQKAKDENYYGTDESVLVERMGEKVFVVKGDPRNIKITSPEDLAVAEVLFDV